MMGSKKTRRTIISSADTNNIITIGEAFERFIREKRIIGKSASTIQNYTTSVRYFKEFCEFDDNTAITSVDKDCILDWTDKLQSKENRSTSTINHYLRDIRAFLYWCMDEERKYLPQFSISEVHEQEPPTKAFKDEDLKVLLRKPAQKGSKNFVEWRNWAVVNLAFDMGARASTICDIRLKDVNFKTNTLYLRHTKNKKLAYHRISTECAKVLQEFIKLYRFNAEEEDYLFCNEFGEYMTYNALRIAFGRYCKTRGVAQHNLHGLRHSFAEHFVEASNGDMAKLQKALGHSTIAMAQKYVDLANIDMSEYDKLSPLTGAKVNSIEGESKRARKRKVICSSNERAS